MKINPKSILGGCIRAALVSGVILIVGPTVIHFAYRSITPLSTKESQIKRYQSLATAETFDGSLSEDERVKMRKERMNLFYWFHSRGWNIDEGDEAHSWFHPWFELVRYWNS